VSDNKHEFLLNRNHLAYTKTNKNSMIPIEIIDKHDSMKIDY